MANPNTKRAVKNATHEPVKTSAKPKKETRFVQTTISKEAAEHAERIAAQDFIKPASQYRRIIEGWHASTQEAARKHN